MYTGSHWFKVLGGKVEGNCFHRCNLQSWTWQRSRWILPAWRKWQILDTALQRQSLLSVAQLQNDRNTTFSAPRWFSKSRSFFGLASWHSVLLWCHLWHSAPPPHLFLQVHWASLPCTLVLVYTWNVQVLSSFVWPAGLGVLLWLECHTEQPLYTLWSPDHIFWDRSDFDAEIFYYVFLWKKCLITKSLTLMVKTGI